MCEPCIEVNTDIKDGVSQENSLDVVFKETKQWKGGIKYTGYIRGLPSVIAQGKTKGETVSNLLSRLIDIYSPYLNGNE